MGFRTLLIHRQSSEVWPLLGAVKTDWGKYGIERLPSTKEPLLLPMPTRCDDDV
jgi:hypothetical protein